MNASEKRLFLNGLVNSKKAVEELLAYTFNKFIKSDSSLPTLSEEMVKTWKYYHDESKEKGCFNTLQKYLVQLQFPVKEGISKTEDYINTTLKGKKKKGNGCLKLNKPNEVILDLYQSPLIGKVPIIIVPNKEDFRIIICAVSNKNEPKELPNSMGALIISGINNWDRIQTLKSDWLKDNPFGNWNAAFKKNILPNTNLYKDQIIVLSFGGYSGVISEQVGVKESEWNNISLEIRREHECTHLFTKQYYGCMANNMHDEIVADYAGITKVLGRFNISWFLHFMGLENYPSYKQGGRLQNYNAPVNLSVDAFDGLKKIVFQAAKNIDSFDEALGKIGSSEEQLTRIKCICEVDLISMASPMGVKFLRQIYEDKKSVAAIC